jgi:hypothetical protein
LLDPHITVDTPERLRDVEYLIRTQQGKFQATDVLFNARASSPLNRLPNEQGLPLLNRSPSKRSLPSNTWHCQECGVSNLLSFKECSTPSCTQWRPIELMPRRSGDWECCGTVQFASRSACFKCGRAKNGSPYEAAPSAPPQSQIDQGPSKRRRQDWICPDCNDHQFARNSECRQCGCYRSKATRFIDA